jgi:hypothetical protein
MTPDQVIESFRLPTGTFPLYQWCCKASHQTVGTVHGDQYRAPWLNRFGRSCIDYSTTDVGDLVWHPRYGGTMVDDFGNEIFVW